MTTQAKNFEFIQADKNRKNANLIGVGTLLTLPDGKAIAVIKGKLYDVVLNEYEEVISMTKKDLSDAPKTL